MNTPIYNRKQLVVGLIASSFLAGCIVYLAIYFSIEKYNDEYRFKDVMHRPVVYPTWSCARVRSMERLMVMSTDSDFVYKEEILNTLVTYVKMEKEKKDEYIFAIHVGLNPQGATVEAMHKSHVAYIRAKWNRSNKQVYIIAAIWFQYEGQKTKWPVYFDKKNESAFPQKTSKPKFFQMPNQVTFNAREIPKFIKRVN